MRPVASASKVKNISGTIYLGIGSVSNDPKDYPNFVPLENGGKFGLIYDAERDVAAREQDLPHTLTKINHACGKSGLQKFDLPQVRLNMVS